MKKIGPIEFTRDFRFLVDATHVIVLPAIPKLHSKTGGEDAKLHSKTGGEDAKPHSKTSGEDVIPLPREIRKKDFQKVSKMLNEYSSSNLKQVELHSKRVEKM